ncbi:MAG: cytosine permease [Pirellulaceae bacterium]
MTHTEPTRNRLFSRLDQINEFERQPISKEKLHSGIYFAGAFAGEHVAATEFVIGALFVTFGAGTFDVIVGLLLGNLMAVLSWTLICAPIAVQTRLTLYWYLRKIAGPGVMVIYNIVNGILFCILGGAMITVAASAVRLPLGIPEQVHWYPEDIRFVLVVLAVGGVVVTLAILGFKYLVRFATVCAPWMLLMFVAGGLVMLPTLGDVRSFSDFWSVANRHIWTGPAPGQTDAIGFWHIAAFAWICNLGMHIGLTDMAVFRYAKRASYGLYSAFGMYLGHYVAWICAGIMGAAAAHLLKRPLTELDSGSVAYQALGAVGVLAVVIAGWTTANPMLYRAGLAFQVITPGWSRWKVTLVAGVITTLTACSPFVFTKMLGFVVIYGLLLMPMGVIVTTEHWVFPRIGLTPFWAARKGLVFNWPALAAWLFPVAIGFWCSSLGLIHLFFLFLPVGLASGVLYIALSAMAGARQSLPELEEKTREAVPAPATGAPDSQGAISDVGWGPLSYLSGGVALLCLAGCFLLPLWIFLGGSGYYTERTATFNALIPWITLAYFMSGALWMADRDKRNARYAPEAGTSGVSG